MKYISGRKRPVISRRLVSVVVVMSIWLPVAAVAAPPAPAAVADAPAEKIPSVGVDALMKTPDTYKGTVRVRGVVSSVFPKAQKLGIIDAIYLNCCSSPCGTPPQSLPVKWTGEMPQAKTLVLVTGEVKRTGEKLEFVARSIDAVIPSQGAAK